jgi:VWFA-related protein
MGQEPAASVIARALYSLRLAEVTLRPLLGVFLSLAALACYGAQAPTPAPDQSATPVFRTHARDVVVDVVVTRSHGEPVSGLRAQDFVVFEDGKPQTLDFFEEHTAKALPPGALPALPKMPPGVYTNVPPAPMSDAVNILLFDMLNTDPQDQVMVRQQVLKFLLSANPGTRIGIFALGSQLRFVQGFTVDMAALRTAIEGLVPGREPASQTRSDLADDRETIAILNELAGGSVSKGGGNGNSPQTTSMQGYYHGGTGSPAIDAFSAAMNDIGEMKNANRMAMTLEALQYLARYLGDVPGRKNLLWFSGNFPVILYPSAAQQLQISSLRGYVSQAKEAANQLTAAKVAVYPIGAEGIMLDHTAEASNRVAVAGRGGDLMGNLLGEASSRADTIYAMEQIAADTGGKAFYNTNDLSAAADHAIADGSHYYTLIYSPTNKKMDGNYRRVEVKVPGEKVQLSYRRGYNADDTLASANRSNPNPLQPLLVHGLPASTQILFAARVVPAAPQPAPNAALAGRNPKLARPVRRYSVDLMIRWTDVKLDEAADGKHTGQIEVELLAYDHAGHTVNWTGGTQSMSLDPTLFASIQRSGVPAHLEIDLPSNEDVDLEAGVYDWSTGKAGTLEIPLAAHPPATEAQPAH